MFSLLNFYEEVKFASDEFPLNKIPNLHFCITFSFPSTASHSSSSATHATTQRTGLTSSLHRWSLLVQEDQWSDPIIEPPSRFFSFPCLCLCVYLLRNGASSISAAQHICTQSPIGNNDIKNNVRLIFPLYVFFPVGLQTCWFYESFVVSLSAV